MPSPQKRKLPSAFQQKAPNALKVTRFPDWDVDARSVSVEGFRTPTWSNTSSQRNGRYSPTSFPALNESVTIDPYASPSRSTLRSSSSLVRRFRVHSPVKMDHEDQFVPSSPPKSRPKTVMQHQLTERCHSPSKLRYVLHRRQGAASPISSPKKPKKEPRTLVLQRANTSLNLTTSRSSSPASPLSLYAAPLSRSLSTNSHFFKQQTQRRVSTQDDSTPLRHSTQSRTDASGACLHITNPHSSHQCIVKRQEPSREPWIRGITYSCPFCYQRLMVRYFSNGLREVDPAHLEPMILDEPWFKRWIMTPEGNVLNHPKELALAAKAAPVGG